MVQPSVMESPVTLKNTLWKEAQALMPGGVNSPVRAWQAVGREPVFLERAKGAKVWDTGGREYIDYIMGWGPLILGHAPPGVGDAEKRVVESGTTFGMPTREEITLARSVQTFFPAIEKLRLTNSGTEATMTALRLARAVTGRSLIVKFDGCYHGHVDALLVKAGSGMATLGQPDSAGVPAQVAASTSSLPYNDAGAFRAFMGEKGDQVAAVIVEPVAGNMGVVPGTSAFLGALREETQRHGALLIFDEVMTGFRVRRGGAQQIFKITPDLTLLGKILGGGLPIGAVGGPAAIMDELSPAGPVYQAGTFSGNRLSVVAGIETLRTLTADGFYESLEEKSARLAAGLEEGARAAGTCVRINRSGSMLSVFFCSEAVTGFSGAQASDAGVFSRFFGALLDGGVLIAPSRFEAWFVSSAHTPEDIEETIARAARAFEKHDA